MGRGKYHTKLSSIEDIVELLQQLNEKQADELEDQHLDFKEWNFKSLKDSVDEVIEMAACMSNGGGGTVILGVKDRIIGLDNAITGGLLEIKTMIIMIKLFVTDKNENH